MGDTRAYLAAAYALIENSREAEHYRTEFLRFCRERMGGNLATDVKRYMAWLIDSTTPIDAMKTLCTSSRACERRACLHEMAREDVCRNGQVRELQMTATG